MNSFFSALSFLTTIPSPPVQMRFDGSMLKWFPAVGLILGLLWAAVDAGLHLFFGGPLAGFLDVLFMILLTGGLHLDGLADMADGLLSHRPLEEKLRIMKDSRIGSWGVLALITILSLKTLAIADLDAMMRFKALLLAPLFGRTAMLIGFGFLPYGRGAEGIGHTLFGASGQFVWKPALAGLVLLALLLGWPGSLAALAAFAIATTLLMVWYKKSIGSITGDMLGGTCEILEAVVLTVLAAI